MQFRNDGDSVTSALGPPHGYTTDAMLPPTLHSHTGKESSPMGIDWCNSDMRGIDAIASWQVRCMLLMKVYMAVYILSISTI